MLDWFKDFNQMTGLATTADTTPSAIIGNTAPVVENISYQSGLGANGALNAGVPTDIVLSFLAMDFDGDDDFNNASAVLNVSLDGSGWHNITSDCTPVTVGSNATAQNYTCPISLDYWDLNGDWTCSAEIRDAASFGGLEVVNCFTVGSTLSMNMTSVNITWASLAVGADNTIMDTAELNITNNGNQNITNVTLKAYDLIGATIPADYIGADNFTATWGERSCDYGQYLINGTNLQILANGTSGRLDFGIGSLEFTNNATHICLEHVGEALSQQTYSAEQNTAPSERYWQITAGTGAIS